MSRRVTKDELARRVADLEREADALRQELQRRSGFYEELLDSIDEGCYEMDLRGNVVSANRAASRLLGCDPSEIRGLNYRAYMSEDTAGRMYEVFHRIYLTGEPQRMVDFDIIRKDGTTRTHEMSASLMRDASGRPTGFRVIARDVTEKHRARETLKHSEELYRTIFENTGSATILIAEDTTILLANTNFATLTGYSRQEIEGRMSWTEFIVAEDLERMRMNHNTRRRDPASAPSSYEFRLMTRSGDIRYIQLTVAMIPGTMNSLASCMDITRLKMAELEARRSERRYRDILDSMEEAYYEVDLKGDFTFFNTRAFVRLGYTQEELNGMNYREYMDEANARKVYEAFHRVFVTGEPVMGFSWELKDRNGNPLYVEASITLRRDEDGTPVGFRGVVRDVTARKKAEEALLVSEKRYRDILESMEESYYETDLRGNFVSFNNAAVRMSGYSEEELRGMNYLVYAPPETARRMFETFNTVYRTGHACRMQDYQVIYKDGTLHDNELTVWPKRDASGAIVGFHSIVRDVTERRRAELEIKKREERYRAIFENTGNATIIIAEDTTILLANSNFATLTGYSRQEIEGRMSWTEFVHEADLERMRRYHVQRRADAGLAPSSYEFRLKTRSGDTRDMIVSLCMIPGTMESIASCLDITDRKRAEEALRRSEERFRDLARLLPETVFEADLSGRITFVNDISLVRFGYTRGEFEQGVSVFDVISAEDHGRLRDNIEKVLQGRDMGLREYSALRKDGSVFPVLVHSTAIMQGGAPVGVRGFLIDVTDKKRLEEQLMRAQKMESIGTLAGGIAHDFNNLLMGILGNVSIMLMKMEEGHPLHERLKSMEEYVRRGSDLTKQLLGFARGGKYEVKTTDLARFVRMSAEMFGRTRKEIRIHHKADPDLWPVDVDRGQMDQVMLNLFVNAWQAMAKGGDIFVSLENAVLGEADAAPHGVRAGRFVKLTVTDTGEGMDPDVLPRIFEPFFTTKERGRGTGLGLASVYGIVRNHGGFILVESEKGIGSSFMIHLPASDKAPAHDDKPRETVRRGGGEILLIDDEEMILDVASGMLENLGYTVVTALGGKEGVRVFGEHRDAVVLVILDMIMPEFSGRETFEVLRRLDPSVRILLSSGYSMDGHAKELMDAGCDGFIQKPFTMAELSARIGEILECDGVRAG